MEQAILYELERCMNIDELSGRDLDAAVAQHVFGLQVEARVNTRTGEKDYLYALPSGDWLRVAYYTASRVRGGVEERRDAADDLPAAGPGEHVPGGHSNVVNRA